jgi:hypothetical protein
MGFALAGRSQTHCALRLSIGQQRKRGNAETIESRFCREKCQTLSRVELGLCLFNLLPIARDPVKALRRTKQTPSEVRDFVFDARRDLGKQLTDELIHHARDFAGSTTAFVRNQATYQLMPQRNAFPNRPARVVLQGWRRIRPNPSDTRRRTRPWKSSGERTCSLEWRVWNFSEPPKAGRPRRHREWRA